MIQTAKIYLACKILQELPYRLDKYGTYVANSIGGKFESLLVRYLEDKFIDEQLLKDIKEPLELDAKPKHAAKAGKKKLKKAVQKRPTVQLMIKPRTREDQRKLSVPVHKGKNSKSIRSTH